MEADAERIKREAKAQKSSWASWFGWGSPSDVAKNGAREAEEKTKGMMEGAKKEATEWRDSAKKETEALKNQPYPKDR